MSHLYLETVLHRFGATLAHYFLEPGYNLSLGWLALYSVAAMAVQRLRSSDAAFASSLRTSFPNLRSEMIAVVTFLFAGELIGVSALQIQRRVVPLIKSFVSLFGSDLSSTHPATTYGNVIYMIAWILAADFGWWLSHYLSHKIPILWEFHKIHHAPTHLNPVSGLRFHPVDSALGVASISMKGLATYVFAAITHTSPSPLTLFGVPLFFVVYNLHANFRHSSIRIHFGKLDPFFSSPASHHIHHSDSLEHRDKNFGIYLSLWDWVFGTYYKPNIEEPIRYGIGASDELAKASPLYLLVEPFMSLAKRVSAKTNDRQLG